MYPEKSTEYSRTKHEQVWIHIQPNRISLSSKANAVLNFSVDSRSTIASGVSRTLYPRSVWVLPELCLVADFPADGAEYTSRMPLAFVDVGRELSIDASEVGRTPRPRETLSHEGTPTFHGALDVDLALESRSPTDVEGG